MQDGLTEKIIGEAIEVHRELGPGLLESIYEEALCYEFELQQIKYKRQVPADVIYKGKVIKGQKIYLLVEDKVVVEIKSLSKMPEVALAQALSYLKATNLKRGLIVNFGEKRLIKVHLIKKLCNILQIIRLRSVIIKNEHKKQRFEGL